MSVGSYDGFFHNDGLFGTDTVSSVRGTLTLKITGLTGKLTARAVVQKGTLSFTATKWTSQTNGTSYVELKARSGETLNLYVRQNRMWGSLAGGTLTESLAMDGARNRFADRKDTVAQELLEKYKGYYTATLPIAGAFSLGAADGAPLGNGYFTVTVGSSGSAKIVGVLADGTSVSMSSRLHLFGDCDQWVGVPLFAPLYSKKGWVGGLLWIDPETRTVVTDRDVGWFVRWEKPGVGPDGFSELLDVCGGYYNTLPSLASNYLFGAEAKDVSYYYNTSNAVGWVTNALPEEVGVIVSGTRMTMARGVRPVMANGVYTYVGDNSSLATLTFTARTGIFKGRFYVYYDYDLKGRLQHKAIGVPYAGVLTPARGAACSDEPAGQGYCLVPDNAPAVKAYRIKRSFPVYLSDE